MDHTEIIETNLQFVNLAYGNVPSLIILHHAEWSRCNVEDIHQDHLNRGWSGIAYNFFVKKDGSIFRGRPEKAIGAHCKGSNSNSIGICAEGNYMVEVMPASQIESIIELCKYLKDKYEINEIRSHKERTNDTECPGVNYPLEQIRDAILNKREEKGVNKVENVVVYGGEGDRPAGELLAYYLQCPLIAFSSAKSIIGSVKNIYIVGGNQTLTVDDKLLFGVDRYETMKEVLKFMGKL